MAEVEKIQVKELSSNGLQNLIEKNAANQIVQVLRIIEYDSARTSWMYIIVAFKVIRSNSLEISDGYSKITALFVGDGAKMVSTGKRILIYSLNMCRWYQKIWYGEDY